MLPITVDEVTQRAFGNFAGILAAIKENGSQYAGAYIRKDFFCR
jgi:hypothetical protein